MDGYFTFLLECEAVAGIVGLVTGALVRWSLGVLTLGLFASALAVLALYLAIGGVPLEVVPEVAGLTALALLPVILVASATGREARRLLRRIAG